MSAGIYKILSPSGKVYIGQSWNIEVRWLRHREANRTYSKLHSSLKKYGWRNHVFEIIHQLPMDVEQEVMDRYETLYMDLYRNVGLELLNIKEGGSAGKFNSESKKKMSEAHKGQSVWNKGLKGAQVAWNKGKTFAVKTYTFKKDGLEVKILGLKKYCEENKLSYFTMLALHNGKGYYKTHPKYREYEK